MSFYQRYELVRLVHNGEPKTFEAREIASSRPVLLHLWSMGDEAHRSALLLRLRDVMRTDPARLLGAVIEVQESAEPPYVVTAPEDGFPGLDAWLESRLTGVAAPPVQPHPPPAAPPRPQPAAAPPAPQGEFTRMFGAASVAPPPEHPAPARPVQTYSPPAHPNSAAAPQPHPQPAPPATAGEFTRLFGAAPSPVEETSLPPAKPSAPPAPPAAPAFQVAPPFGPLQTSAPARPAAPGQPGEFTRLFGNPLGANPLPVEEIERGVLAPPPATPTERPFRGPSDFTIQFGHNKSGDAPPPPPPEFPKNLAATGLFSVPLPRQAEQFAPPSAPSGPGEFTRVMMRPAGMDIPLAPAPLAPMAPQAPPAPGTLPASFVPNRKPWLAPLIAVVTTVVVLLLITIIVLLLKR